MLYFRNSLLHTYIDNVLAVCQSEEEFLTGNLLPFHNPQLCLFILLIACHPPFCVIKEREKHRGNSVPG